MGILEAIETRYQRAQAYHPMLARDCFWLTPLDKELIKEACELAPTSRDIDRWRNTYPLHP